MPSLHVNRINVSGFHRFANSVEEATHKFPTSIHWGEGYFKGMRHIVADSSIAAYETMKHFRKDCDWENLWRREAGKWVNCKDLKESEANIITGRIEAFEFMATQFETYASDNDELHKRYGTRGKSALAVAAKRSQTFRDAAEDCRQYATKQKEELERLEK